MISMQQVLQLPIMNTALPLTSNADSSSITVYWASVIETPVEDFVRPRELILSSGIGCQNERELLEFIEELMEAGASGLILSVGHYISSIPENVIDFCETKAFPLVEIPWEIRFSDITEAISEALHKSSLRSIDVSNKIRTDLLEIILEGKGMEAIASYVYEQLHIPMLVVDKRGRLKTQTDQSSGLAEWWNQYLSQGGNPLFPPFQQTDPEKSLPANMEWMDTDAGALLRLTVQTTQDIQGYMILQWPTHKEKHDVFEEYTLLLLEHSVTTSALCFLHDQTALETEMRLKDDFVWSLAKDNYESRDQALSRGKSLGYNLELPYICFVAKPENLERVFHAESPPLSYDHWLEQIGYMFEEEVSHASRYLKTRVMSTFQKSELIVYLEMHPTMMYDTVYYFAETVQYRLEQKTPHLVISWGISKTAAPWEFVTSFSEASSALDAGRRQRGFGYIHTYEDTRFDRALMSLAKNEEIRQIAEATVAPLHHYSVERGIDLMKTVRTYNECKGNVSQTSRELNLHRQSLLYRLKKIESLTSCDLNNSDDLFLIELSIRLHTAGALFVTDERPPHV